MTSAKQGVAASLALARSCHASDAHMREKLVQKLRARSRVSGLANAHSLGRGAAATASGLGRTGLEHPRMYRLTGLEESSPKKDGRTLAVGNRPVNVWINVSRCSTTTQSASAHQQRRKKAIPQNMRPSRRFAWVCVLSL
eukprot:4888178-Pleurochrysis_carterae.AAC.1